jgi:hypothetical protein
MAAPEPARGDPFLLTFEGLQNGEPVLNFYNGGTGGFGSGPGINFGASFTSEAWALKKVFPGDPSATVMFLTDGSPTPGLTAVSATLNVTPGFSHDVAFDFYLIDSSGSATVWSGPNGTGTMVASVMLNPVSSFTTVDLPFTGVAHSMVLSGFNQQIAFDNIRSPITFTIVPEPPMALLLTAVGVVVLAFRARPARST